MKARSVLLLVVVACMVTLSMGAKAPGLSKCTFGRAVWYEIARSGGVPQGTCGFGPVVSDMPSYVQQGYVTAPDDETYNGYPFYPPVYGGKSWACGECYEVTGPQGTITVMVADVCDIGCCSNVCKGSQGGDVQNFDIDSAVWKKVVNQTAGSVTIKFRLVPCEMGGKTLSMYVNGLNEGKPQAGYFRLRFYNSIIGIKNAQVKQGNTWLNLTKGFTNNWDWINRGVISFPFKVAVTANSGEVIEFPQSFTADSLAPLAKYNSGKQFKQPPPVSKKVCKWPGPSPKVFKDKFGSTANIAWRDWGSWSVTVNYDYKGSECPSKTCIRASGYSRSSGIQIGYPTAFPKDFFASIRLTLRAASGSVSGMSVKFYTGGSYSNAYALPTITTTPQTVVIPFSAFTVANNKIQVMQILGGGSTPTTVFIDDIVLAKKANCNKFNQKKCNKKKFQCKWTQNACQKI